MRAINMLVKASKKGDIDPRSVSMIILVSDGDPTVGKTGSASRLAGFSNLVLQPADSRR